MNQNCSPLALCYCHVLLYLLVLEDFYFVWRRKSIDAWNHYVCGSSIDHSLYTINSTLTCCVVEIEKIIYICRQGSFRYGDSKNHGQKNSTVSNCMCGGYIENHSINYYDIYYWYKHCHCQEPLCNKDTLKNLWVLGDT